MELLVRARRQGGIVFQRDRSPGEILWVSGGENDPRSLVAPTDGQFISIQDVGVEVGGPVVWFIRGSGREIDDVETLHKIALDGDEEVEIGEIGGWESGASISVGGGLVVSEWFAEASHGFSAHDLTFEEIEADWNPYGPEGEADCGPCPRSVDMASDGSRVGWVEGRNSGDFFVPTLVVTGTDRGEEQTALPLPSDLPGEIVGLDVGASSILISLAAEEGSWLPALSIDTEDGSMVGLPIAGNARWAGA